MNPTVSAREIERAHTEPVGLRVEQGQTCVFMLKHTPQAAGNYLKELKQIESRNERVIHLEQHAQTVPLSSQLLLISPCCLEVQRVIHGDGHLARHLLHEVNLTAVIMMRFELSKA